MLQFPVDSPSQPQQLRRAAGVLLILAVLLVTLVPSLLIVRNTHAASSLTLLYANASTAATSNSVSPHFELQNNTGASIALSTITIRYWYTEDGTQSQQFTCDYALVGSTNVTGTFASLTSPTSTADSYLQVGFTSGAGSIAANGNSGEIQARFNKSDWSNYNQANDYSWSATQTSYAAWNNVTVYLNGQLVWGTEPGGNSATPTPTTITTPGATPTATPIVTPTSTPIVTPTPTPISSGSLCAGATFCDGFENQTGTIPSGTWQVSYPNCQGTGTVAVDHTVAHSGSTSIRVNGTDGYCNHVFFGTSSAFTGVGTDIYVRYFVRHTTPLPTGHVASVAMRDNNDGGNDLRFGGQNGALQWNRSSDDATLPEQSPAGVALSAPLPTNQWSCLQFEVNEAQGTMRTWLNGTEVAGLHLDNVPTINIDSQWIQSRPNWRPNLVDLRLGWESYSGGNDTLWFDDIAVGAHQLSCS